MDEGMITACMVLLSRFLQWAVKVTHRGSGSSFPGLVVRHICPNILKRITLPDYVVAVTGSNGKTSTVEMMAHILSANGKKVAYNREGSNQIDGVTSLVLRHCNLKGKLDCDVILIESDERFARHTFRFFTPTHYVITNLYRDQLSRNGHPEWVYRVIGESIHPETRLILNADDPLVSCFGLGRENVVWFGVNRLPTDTEACESIYNDGVLCPNCKARLEYDYFHYNHIGSYHCPSCGLKRNETDFTVTKADLEQGFVEINGSVQIPLTLRSLYNVYNLLAAFSVASLLGIDANSIAKHMGRYVLKNGRVVTFTLGGHKGTLLTSKHENSISYNQSIRYVVSQKEDCTVVVIVDAVSRKYYTSEISWLWDIDFELLRSANVKDILLCGNYCFDLQNRFEYCEDIPADRIRTIEGIPQAAAYLKDNAVGHIYVITCFSDKDKILSLVQMEEPADKEAAQ